MLKDTDKVIVREFIQGITKVRIPIVVTQRFILREVGFMVILDTFNNIKT